MRKSMLVWAILGLILLPSCVSRIQGNTCEQPDEYKKKPVVTILKEAYEIVKRPSEKKAVVFSVYGSKKIYLEGILENISLSKEMYPSWDVLVFVHEDSVPKEFKASAEQKGAIVLANASYNHASSRFFVADLNYDRFIVRDADSRIYPREVAAVADWMKNDWAIIHGMRDAGSASDPLQAGMWGGVTKRLREKLKEIQGNDNMEFLYYKYMGDKKEIYGDDQKFLADIIVKSVGYDAFMSHESSQCHAFPKSRGFPIRKGVTDHHIGTRIIVD